VLYDVCFAMTGDPRRNSRALRQLRVWESMGARVCVVAAGEDAAALPGKVDVVSVPQPRGGGPKFFLRNHLLMLRALRGIAASVYHASDLFVLPAAAHATRQRGARLGYDARELYPHVFGTVGKPWATAFWTALEGRYVRRADHVFTVNDSIAERMARRYSIARPTVVHNLPDAASPPTPTDALRDRTGIAPGVPIALYHGALFPHRGLLPLLDASGHVPGLAVVLMGDGPLRPDLARRTQAPDLAGRAFVVDPVAPDDLLGIAASADIGAVTLDDACLSYRLALPNKLFEYLRAGLPVVASDLPELRAVVAGHDVGLLTPPGDAAAIADALARLVSNGDLRARLARNAPRVFETYRPRDAFERFGSAYHALLNR
jgi:glycosyltransferase involved in cell wall biosynthesis